MAESNFGTFKAYCQYSIERNRQSKALRILNLFQTRSTDKKGDKDVIGSIRSTTQKTIKI